MVCGGGLHGEVIFVFVPALALIPKLADYLAEVHQNEIDNDHAGDDLDAAPCSYCAVIAEAQAVRV